MESDGEKARQFHTWLDNTLPRTHSAWVERLGNGKFSSALQAAAHFCLSDQRACLDAFQNYAEEDKAFIVFILLSALVIRHKIFSDAQNMLRPVMAREKERDRRKGLHHQRDKERSQREENRFKRDQEEKDNDGQLNFIYSRELHRGTSKEIIVNTISEVTGLKLKASQIDTLLIGVKNMNYLIASLTPKWSLSLATSLILFLSPKIYRYRDFLSQDFAIDALRLRLEELHNSLEIRGWDCAAFSVPCFVILWNGELKLNEVCDILGYTIDGMALPLLNFLSCRHNLDDEDLRLFHSLRSVPLDDEREFEARDTPVRKKIKITLQSLVSTVYTLDSKGIAVEPEPPIMNIETRVLKLIDHDCLSHMDGMITVPDDIKAVLPQSSDDEKFLAAHLCAHIFPRISFKPRMSRESFYECLPMLIWAQEMIQTLKPNMSESAKESIVQACISASHFGTIKSKYSIVEFGTQISNDVPHLLGMLELRKRSPTRLYSSLRIYWAETSFHEIRHLLEGKSSLADLTVAESQELLDRGCNREAWEVINAFDGEDPIMMITLQKSKTLRLQGKFEMAMDEINKILKSWSVPMPITRLLPQLIPLVAELDLNMQLNLSNLPSLLQADLELMGLLRRYSLEDEQFDQRCEKVRDLYSNPRTPEVSVGLVKDIREMSRLIGLAMVSHMSKLVSQESKYQHWQDVLELSNVLGWTCQYLKTMVDLAQHDCTCQYGTHCPFTEPEYTGPIKFYVTGFGTIWREHYLKKVYESRHKVVPTLLKV